MEKSKALEFCEVNFDPTATTHDTNGVRSPVEGESEMTQKTAPVHHDSVNITTEYDAVSSKGDEISKSSHSRNSDDAHDYGNSEDIVWLYLTYETDLPHPTTLEDNHRDSDDPQLRVPDLGPYGNPLEWSRARKTILTWLACIATTITAYGAGCYAPGVDLMAGEFNISTTVAYLGITVFTLGFAIAPMVLAPFSELVGRRFVFLAAGFFFLVFTICCAVTPTFAGLLVSRFLTGCASSTFSTMGGGVISDVYEAHDRNTPMTIFTAGALFGTGLGPLVSGFLVQNLHSWQWIFYFHTILVGLLLVALVFLFNETRGSVLLSRKANKLNEWYEHREKAGYSGFQIPVEGTDKKVRQRIRWKVKAAEERASIAIMIKISLTRPFHLLFTEPVVFFFALWLSFAWSILYAQFSVITYIFETVYGFSLEQATGIFSVISIATVIATFLGIGEEKLANRRRETPAGPERRLGFPCIGSVSMAGALFWFGWTSTSSIPWIVPAIAVGFATFGIFSIYLAGFNYLADTYGRYASSAIAAQSFCRNLAAGAFPLFTKQMFETLGNGPAGSLLGGIGAVLAAVPWVLLFYGPTIRAKSKIASQMMAES